MDYFSRFAVICLTCGMAVSLAVGPVAAQMADDNLSELVDAREIPVTIHNFARAASDIELDKYVTLAGGVNGFYHFREPTPVDNQPTIRIVTGEYGVFVAESICRRPQRPVVIDQWLRLTDAWQHFGEQITQSMLPVSGDAHDGHAQNSPDRHNQNQRRSRWVFFTDGP